MTTTALVLRSPDQCITRVRGHAVILDSDLAALYGVPVKRLNEQVRRNKERFPEHFVFQLTENERLSLRSQNATLKRGQHRKYLPYVFTEHGAIMAATVLNSPQAIKMSIAVVTAFVNTGWRSPWRPWPARSPCWKASTTSSSRSFSTLSGS